MLIYFLPAGGAVEQSSSATEVFRLGGIFLSSPRDREDRNWLRATRNSKLLTVV